MTREEAILTLNANVVFACERAGFDSATVKMVEDALDTIEDALQVQEPCEDAVSREAAIKCCTFGRTSLGLIEELRRLPSVQPVPVARVMTLEELVVDDVVWLEDYDKDTTVPGIYCNSNDTNTIFATRMKGYLFVNNDEYGSRWRCWTSRPTDEQKEVTPWN